MEATMVQYPPQQQVYMQNGVPIPVATPADGYPGNQPMVYQQQRQTGNRGALGMGLAGGLLGGWALGSMMDGGGGDFGGGDFGGGGDGGF